MDVATLANFLLFLGAFGASLAASEDEGRADRDDDDGLYDSADYARTDRFGDEDDEVAADADNLAWFLEGGNDSLTASPGDDYADLGSGADVAAMGAGNDRVEAGGGDDLVAGGDGDDFALGGAGNDLLAGDAGSDGLGGDAGDDTLTGGSGADILSGGSGNDLISGFSATGGAAAGMGAADGADRLFGGEGADRLILGRGDSAAGGAGADRFEMDIRWQDGSAGVVISDYAAGEDSLVLHYAPELDPDSALPLPPTLTVETSADGLSSLILLDGRIVATVEGVPDLAPAAISLVPDPAVDPGYHADSFAAVLPGTDGADEAAGTAGADYGRFGAGDDAALGAEGADSLLGQAGADTLSGGAGSDTLSGGAEADALSGEDGDDLLAGDLGPDVLSGGTGADRLYGGGGDDHLSGGDAQDAGGSAAAPDGADSLFGGDGNDLLILGKADLGLGGAGADRFRLDAASNPDAAAFATIDDYDPGSDRIELHYAPEYDSGGTEVPPAVDVLIGPAGAYAVITFNGDPLAHVTGAAGLTPADITLIRA